MKKSLEELVNETKNDLNIISMSEHVVEEGIGDFFGFGKKPAEAPTAPDDNKKNLEDALAKAKIFIDKTSSEIGNKASLSPEEYKKYAEDLRQVFASVGPADKTGPTPNTATPPTSVKPTAGGETNSALKPSSVTPMANPLGAGQQQTPTELPAVKTEPAVALTPEELGEPDLGKTDSERVAELGQNLQPASPLPPKPQAPTPGRSIQDLSKNLKVTPTSTSTELPSAQQPVLNRVRNLRPNPYPTPQPPPVQAHAMDTSTAVQGAKDTMAARAERPSNLTKQVAPGRNTFQTTNLPNTPPAGRGENLTSPQQFTANPTKIGVTPPLNTKKGTPYVDQSKALAAQSGQKLHRPANESVFLDPDDSLFD